MSSTTGQNGVDEEQEVQKTTASLAAAANDNDNSNDVLASTTEYVTGWRLVAIAIALVMSIFLVWEPLDRYCAYGERTC